MVFKGIYPAPDLTPLEFGLFSAADVTRHSPHDDEGWMRGFSVEFDTQPTLNLLDGTGGIAHTLFDGSRLPRFFDAAPFWLEVEDFRSAFSLTGEDRFARVLKQLEAATQKMVETELWNGYSARADGNDNRYLTKPGAFTYASTTPSATEDHPRALAMLEHALASSPVGEQGVIHMSRELATHLGSQWLLMRTEDSRGKFHLETMNGTTVSVGSGNTGDGPVADITTAALTTNVVTITTLQDHQLLAGETVRVSGLGAPYDGEFTILPGPGAKTFTYARTHADVLSDTVEGFAQMVGTNDTKWMFATGSVYVHLGKSEVVNENLAQGFDVTTGLNDMRIKANRPAVVYFDPTTHYAIKVRLSS
jgi:hypothetical protein